MIRIDAESLRGALDELRHLRGQVTSLQARCTELLLENRELKAKATSFDRWLKKLPCGHTAHVLFDDGACPVCDLAEADAREAENFEEECKRLRGELQRAKQEAFDARCLAAAWHNELRAFAKTSLVPSAPIPADAPEEEKFQAMLAGAIDGFYATLRPRFCHTNKRYVAQIKSAKICASCRREASLCNAEGRNG